MGLIEAAYRLDLDERAWLQTLITCAEPFLLGGLGATAYTYRFAPELQVDTFVVGGPAPSNMEAIAHGMRDTGPAEGTARVFLSGACYQTASSAFASDPGSWDHFARFSAAAGFSDAVGILGHDPAGTGVQIVAPLLERRTVTVRARRSMSRVASHLAAGLRLRRALDGAEAVFRADGRCLHAEGWAEERAARDRLSLAVKRAERSRGRLRRADPDGAVESWEALVDGRWSLVEREERDGQRHLLARPNAPRCPGPSTLTPRERQVATCATLGWSNKLIGYTLGLATSSVANQLRSAAKRLKVGTRLELIARMAPFVPGRPAGAVPSTASLTASEQEVLERLLRGESNAAIARARRRATRTVANQVVAIFRKLGVASRHELAARLQARP